MSDKLLLADGSTSDNATGEEQECPTSHRDLDKCPTKQQAGNRAHVWDYDREADYLMRMRPVCENDILRIDSDVFLPYLIGCFEPLELSFEVCTANCSSQTR